MFPRFKTLAVASVIMMSPWVASGGDLQFVTDVSGCQTVEGSYCLSAVDGAVLNGVVGTVSILRNASTLTGATGATLVAGDRVVTDKGSALVVLGPHCKINIGDFSSARLSSSIGLTCVSIGGAAASSNNTSSNNLLAGAAVLGGAGAAAALAGGGGSGSGSGSP